MKRTLLAAAWVAGSTIPLLMATVAVYGCCVLPFHQVTHRVLMPVCHLATGLLDGARDDDTSSTPAREKQQPSKSWSTELTSRFVLNASADASRTATPLDAAGYRSFISLGATRCDQDVGLHVVIATFLI